jgi:HlyD family secretion protein
VVLSSRRSYSGMGRALASSMSTRVAADAVEIPAEVIAEPGHRGRRRALLIVGSAAAVAAVGVFGWGRLRPPANSPVKLETAPVVRGNLQARVTATGTLSALVTVQVGSQISGRIQEISVDFNSPVKKGQVIARIDPRLFAAAAEQARANHVAAKANLERARAQEVEARKQYQRTKALAKQRVAAESDLDVAEAAARTAEAQVRAAVATLGQARAARDQAETTLAYTTIVSPSDGIVISRNVDVGQTVAASFQAPTLFVIAEDLRQMQVDTNVAEADVGRLRPGTVARFLVDAYPTKVFEGRIRQIRNAPQTIQNVVTYDAVIDVANPELELKPGMTANVTFIYAERTRALLVPNAALRFRPPAALVANPGPATTEGDHRVVWRLGGDGRAVATSIRVGVSDGALTEVVDGELGAGDRIVTDATVQAGSRAGSFGRVF